MSDDIRFEFHNVDCSIVDADEIDRVIRDEQSVDGERAYEEARR